jgi:hypothetical protein
MQKFWAGAPAAMALGVLAYAWWNGFSILADWFAPGIWGYVAAGAFVVCIGLVPLLLMSGSLRRLVSRYGMMMLISFATIVVAVLAGAAHLPAWTATVVVIAALGLLSVGSVAASIRSRVQGRRAQRYLQRHRPSPDQKWAAHDWIFAYRQCGLPAPPALPNLRAE